MSDPTVTPTEHRRTILVVDDAQMFREIETVFLERYGNVISASDGDEALELARRETPDVVVTDLRMQRMDGDVLVREIRRDPDLRRLPVVVVTGGSPEEHERAVRAGANDVVEKPIQRTVLIHVVNRFLRLNERGLERVPLDAEVRVAVDGEELWGRSHDVSRGGMFVETEPVVEPGREVELEFRVPDTDWTAAPTARVAWRRPTDSELTPGLGLQFLKLDRDLARWLEDYVYELASAEALAPPR